MATIATDVLFPEDDERDDDAIEEERDDQDLEQLREEDLAFLEPIDILSKQIAEALKNKDLIFTLGDVRYIVDVYYQMQELRKRNANQFRLKEKSEPMGWIFSWFIKQLRTMEAEMHAVLRAWAGGDPMCKWAQAQKGIGPVIACGLRAHIAEDVETAGQIWRFAGLDCPENYTWQKGMKRPWNARLKVLCWKIGDSFVKIHRKKGAYYGKLYKERKDYEEANNESGKLAHVAKKTLETRNLKDKKLIACYESGKLPKGRIELRARRWAVKLFLAHWFEVLCREVQGREPPLPYPIAHLETHTHWKKAPPMPKAKAKKDDKGRGRRRKRA